MTVRRVFAVSLVALLCSACEEPLSGSFEVRSATGDVFTFAPQQCVDGSEYGYWGVQLRDGGRAMDIFERDDVPYALVYSPGQTAFELELESCGVFEGRLKRRSINGSGTSRGHFTLECVAEDGREIVGEMHFEDCGSPDDDDDDHDD